MPILYIKPYNLPQHHLPHNSLSLLLHRFFILPTFQEIENNIKNLKVTSPGHDKLDIAIVKKCSNIISNFFEYIINKSFVEGVFPSNLQIARVVTIFKEGGKSLHNNYRPVSNLSCFSKIIEKIIATKLINYITKCSLMSDKQFGFKLKYSTELAVQQLCQHIYDEMDNRLYKVTVFCDFTKAFDTISHSILLESLEYSWCSQQLVQKLSKS